jgi:hypothetical protein
MLQSAMEGPFALIACFEEDVAMLALNPSTYAASFFEQKPDNATVFDEISRFHQAMHAIGRKAFDKCVSCRGRRFVNHALLCPSWTAVYLSFHPMATTRVRALKGLACRKRVAHLARLPPPASMVRPSRRLRDTLVAAPGLLAHACVTEVVAFPMGPKQRYTTVNRALLCVLVARVCAGSCMASSAWTPLR